MRRLVHDRSGERARFAQQAWPGAGAFQALGTRERRHQGGEIGELICLQSDKLVAGLRGLERARRGLARRYQGVDLRPCAIEVADDTGLP